MKSVYYIAIFLSDRQKERIYQVKEALVKTRRLIRKNFHPHEHEYQKQNSAALNGKKQPSSSMLHKFLRPTSLLRSSTINGRNKGKRTGLQAPLKSASIRHSHSGRRRSVRSGKKSI